MVERTIREVIEEILINLYSGNVETKTVTLNYDVEERKFDFDLYNKFVKRFGSEPITTHELRLGEKIKNIISMIVRVSTGDYKSKKIDSGLLYEQSVLGNGWSTYTNTYGKPNMSNNRLKKASYRITNNMRF